MDQFLLLKNGLYFMQTELHSMDSFSLASFTVFQCNYCKIHQCINSSFTFISDEHSTLWLYNTDSFSC